MVTVDRAPERSVGGLLNAEWAAVAVVVGMITVAGLTQTERDASVVLLAGLGLALVLPLSLLGRRPLEMLGLVVALDCIYVATVPLAEPVQFNSTPVAVMLAMYVVASRTPWRQAVVIGAIVATVILVASAILRGGAAASLFAFDMVLVAAAIGIAVRNRQRHLSAMEVRAVTAEESREAEARRRVNAERLRMARELHDVVAHNLALVNAQAGVAEYLLAQEDPSSARQALKGITDHTRHALDELRATVGLLRQAADDQGESGTAHRWDDEDLRPVVSMNDLPQLLAAHRAAGGTTTLLEVGEQHRPVDLPAVADLALYRITQEALTNARKHAPGQAVEVAIVWSESRVDLVVENPIVPGEKHPEDPLHYSLAGFGLIGMAERAHASGGELVARSDADGRFRVRAFIPYDGRSDQ